VAKVIGVVVGEGHLLVGIWWFALMIKSPKLMFLLLFMLLLLIITNGFRLDKKN